MAGLPKRYAKLGFKNGWRAYKSSLSGRSTAKVETVARRRKGFKRRAVGFARRAARRGGVGNSAALLQVDAMAYGAARQFVSDKLEPFTSKIPIAGFSDEIGMGLLSWGVAKYAGKGMLGSIARKGLVIENARVGERLAQQGLGGLSVVGSPSNANTQGWI